ncbi:MAG: prepilin-type N-terminal cleavage/methylation domain-containing protein [Planctomycetota bacterium]
MPGQGRGPVQGVSGFTLIEVVVAMAILSIVLLSFLGTRTDALVDASEARNWRLARELAEQILSELQAGARDRAPDVGRMTIEGYDDFTYQILVGETAISDFESQAAGDLALGAEDQRGDRVAWQQERDELRRAQASGKTLQDFRDDQLREELDRESEERVPSEDEFEEVMVVVFFPEVRLREEALEASFSLKARVPTLAIEGLTPEEAEALGGAFGDDADAAAGGDGTGEGTPP